MRIQTRATALLQHLDGLIQKYDQTHPEISKDLRAHRDALREHLQRGTPIERAKIALRISVWIKFIMDHWPDG